MGVLIFVCLLMWSVPSHSEGFLPASHPKVKATQEIFNRLVGAIGDVRIPPDIRVVAGKASNFDVALYSPSRRTIYVEEEFYDLAHSVMPQDLPQALALILGHELAHFYRNHAWAEDFNRAFAARQVRPSVPPSASTNSFTSPSPTERRRLEAEADYFAGFYGYLAGLPSVAIAAPLFDSVYEHYHYDPALPAYEHLRQRKDTAGEAQQKLRSLIPLFETGVQTLLIQDFGSAERIFDRIATEFPSPEVLSNAAVADILSGLRWGSPAERQYVYPLLLDPDSRLVAAPTRGGDSVSPEETAERRRIHLERAKRRLERIINLHPTYVPAHINLACALDLLSEFESAAVAARTALLLSQRHNLPAALAQATTIGGIVSIHQGQQEQGMQAIKQAAAMGDWAAERNLQLSAEGGNRRHPITAPSAYGPDQVGSLNIVDITEKTFLQARSLQTLGRWDEAGDELPLLTIQAMEQGATRATALLRGAGPARSVVFIATAEREAIGTTVRGIKIGQARQAVEQAYGVPDSTVILPRGRYVRYHHRTEESEVGVVFRYDDAQAVQTWFVYRMEGE
jgi:hypothetical protein